MPDQSTCDFAQTAIGSATPISAGSTHSFLPGTLLNGRYRIVALLGKGGMGEVYRATDLTLGQSVALKFLPHLATSDPRWLERFHSKVRIARQVSHPNVCADRRGAMRFFFVPVICTLLAWAIGTHDIPDGRMINFASYTLPGALLGGLIMWQLYLALEHALRSRWPQSIITWKRVLSGRFLDTQVGAHTLMGVGMGIVITTAFMFKGWFNLERSGILGVSSIHVTSASDWLATHILTANGALTMGLIIFFTIFGLKVLFRRELPAMLIACFGIIFGLVRFDMLTSIVAVFVTNTMGGIAATSDPTVWFMPFTIATLVFVAALAILAFWRSLGGQSLVGNNPQ